MRILIHLALLLTLAGRVWAQTTIPAVTLTVPGCTVPAQTFTVPKNGGKVTIAAFKCPAQTITIPAYTIPAAGPATYEFACTAPVKKADGTADMTKLSCKGGKP